MALVLDILIAVLLIATLVYAFMLNRRLNDLRKDRAHLEAVVIAFRDATATAEASIQKLKNYSDKAAHGVDEVLGRAQAVKDDLSFLIERANGLADRLEDGVRKTRPNDPAFRPGSGAEPEDPAAAARSEAERELLRALQSVR